MSFTLMNPTVAILDADPKYSIEKSPGHVDAYSAWYQPDTIITRKKIPCRPDKKSCQGAIDSHRRR